VTGASHDGGASRIVGSLHECADETVVLDSLSSVVRMTEFLQLMGVLG
jgi:hypothetical protein